MATDGRNEDLEARLARLEARVEQLEAGSATARPESQAPTPPTAETFWQTAAPTPTPTTPPAADQPRSHGPASSPAIQPTIRPPKQLMATLAELEERLAGRALAIAGGIALILGTIFFLSLAFSRGWIGPELRVLIGLAAGSASVAGGAVFLERRNTLLGNVLTPVGLAIISISLVGATRLYHIIPTELGLLGALASAVAVAAIALRYDSQLVAAFGLVSVLIAPPLLGASADTSTLVILGAVLVGSTSIALWRSWSWLPAVAFLLTVPQAMSWVAGHPPVGIALVGLVVYWALNVVAAGGEEFRRHREDLSPSSSTVLLGNAAFVVWAGFVTLSDDLAVYRGLFLVIVAAAHAAVGGWFVARHGERDLFGLLTLGTGIAALTMAIPVQLGAPAVPIAWTAEAVALAFVAARRGHPYSLAVSAVLYLLAAGAVATLFPLDRAVPDGVPFLDANGGALAFFLGGVAVGIWFLRDRTIRSGLAGLGVAVTLYAVTATLTGIPFVVVTTGLMVIGAGTITVIPRLPSRAIKWQLDGLIPASLREPAWRPIFDRLLPAMTALSGAAAAIYIATEQLPILEIDDRALPAIPFAEPGAVSGAILIGGVLASGWILRGAFTRRAELPIAALVSGLIAAYVIPFEVEPWAVVVLWVTLGIGALAVARRERDLAVPFELAAGTAIIAAALLTLGEVAPLRRLVVGATAVPPILILQSAAAIGAVGAGIARFARAWPEPTIRRWTRIAAGVFAVYLASVLAVDMVGLRGGGDIALAELRTQGQVVLSVLWATLGVAALMFGIRTGSRELRVGGLALLATATAKVFLFDLAALDVAYRVISFIALGLLLLAAAWVWQRAQPKRTLEPDAH